MDDEAEAAGGKTTDTTENLKSSLEHLLADNLQHFKTDESEKGQHLYGALLAIEDNFQKLAELTKLLETRVHEFDLSEEEQGNGFRSFLNMVNKSTECVFQLCKQISTGRSSFLFNKKIMVKEAKAWGDALASLSTMLKYLLSHMIPSCTDGNLLPDTVMAPRELFSILNQISQYPFYGRCLGFHYHEAMQKIFKVLSIGLCTFSEVYYSDGGMVKRTKQSLFNGQKYMYDPEARSRRTVDVIQYSSISFVKAYWSLADTDILSQVPALVGPTVLVDQPIIVPCHDLRLENMHGEEIVFPPPVSHILPNPIKCFLLSSVVREGMPGEKNPKNTTVLPPSNCIIFHCHGGGFVSQSTKAQEVYLRDWANSLGVPIFSVDYSLAPEAKYPRPLEEVVCAYVWMLNNLALLGTTGSKIIVTGDSAGGNLVTSLTLKCIEKQIRYPDGIFVAYTPFKIVLQPSPSKLLGCMDPLLPLGFALRCLKAYAGNSSPITSPTSPEPSEVSPVATGPSENIEDLELDIDSSFVQVTQTEAEEAKIEITENKSDESDSMSTVSLSPGSPVSETKKSSDEYVSNFIDNFAKPKSGDRSSNEPLEFEETGTLSPRSTKKKTIWSGLSSPFSWSKTKQPVKESLKEEPKKKQRSRSVGRINLGTTKLQRDNSMTLAEEFGDIIVPDDYFLSPYKAPDEMLSKFPPISVLTSEYDFCLDDCVMMSRKLRQLKVPVTLDVLPKLPHGFMNLNLTSKEAHDGTKVAINRIRVLLGCDDIHQHAN